MAHSPLTARLARRTLPLAAALLTAAIHAQNVTTAPARLDPYITTATRTPAAPQTVGTDVTVITASDLARQQVSSLADALGTAGGAPVFTSGAPGAVTSVFLRGANSNQTLFLVDGIRLNDANTDYQAFLGGAKLGAGDRVEIARGPQSTLYGAEAIGGVVAISAMRGTGAPTSRVAAEAGSYGSIDGSVAGQGAVGADAWNFTAQAAHTDNARPNDHFDSANVTLRLDHAVKPGTDVGATFRWYHGDIGSPGDRFTNDGNNRETESNLLATAFVDAQPATDWHVHGILGGQDRRYVYATPTPNPPYGAPSGETIVTNRRGVVDIQTTYTGVERNRMTAGVTAEAEQTRNTGFGAIDQHQRLLAVFAQDEFSPVDNVYLSGGLRADDFDTFGHATTGRVTAAWVMLPNTLKLRSSYGTGFRSPSFLDLYGRDAYYVGNPELRPERDRGLDAGVDYYLPQHRGTITATWFEADTRNLIDYDFTAFPSTTVNVGRARSQGVEFAAQTVLAGDVGAMLSYTYLDARSLLPAGHTRLLRRPENQVSADLHRELGGGVSVGAGLLYVGRRADVDAQTYTTIVDGGWTTVRVYASWQATAQVLIKARIENALDRRYEAVNGYPALGAAAFGGIEWKF